MIVDDPWGIAQFTLPTLLGFAWVGKRFFAWLDQRDIEIEVLQKKSFKLRTQKRKF